MVYTCCVPSCRERTGKMHTFPHAKPQVYQEWLRRIQRQEFFGMDPKKVARSYRVCERHFSAFAKVGNQCRSKTGLKVYAVPTLHLPGFHEASTLENSLLSPNTQLPGVEPVPGLSNQDNSRPLGHDFQELAIPGSSTSTLHTPIKRKGSPRDMDRSPKQRRSDIKKRTHFLRLVNASRSKQLSPRAHKLYKVARDLKSIARRLDFANADLKDRLKTAKDFCTSEEYLKSKVNTITYNFLKCQIEQQSITPKGRRFSLDDKLLALTLMKQSPRGYRLLQKCFALPSTRTLSNLLRKIPFKDGLNIRILQTLQLSVAKLKSIDKNCILMFDEMTIEPNLSFNAAEDKIEGFTTIDGTKIADHVMVFMAAGICKKWKQPIAYFFTEHGMSSLDIAVNLKMIINKLQSIGLRVVGTVCDQLATNGAAYKRLKEETREYCIKHNKNIPFGFLVNEEEVIPIFDAPHLLKGMRNNFLEGDIKFTQNGENKMAKWQDIVDFYEADVGDEDFKICNKLTDCHIYKNKIKKMKVKYAAQVFSHSLSSVMRAFVTHGFAGLQKSAKDTADFLLFMDKLFDSVNSSTKNAPYSKPVKGAVKEGSPHIEYWYECIKVLESLTFCSEKRASYIPPTVKNWILTLKGIMQMWNILKNQNVEYFCTRNVNQDPLENLFSIIRSHGVRNINPTPTNFKGSFKTLILNNFTSASSPWANCEEDVSSGSLECLRSYLQEAETPQEILDQAADNDENFSLPPHTNTLPTKGGLYQYLGGYVAKKILKKVKNCEKCIAELTTTNRDAAGILIKAKALTSKSLLIPSANFNKILINSFNVIKYFLPKFAHKNNLSALIIQKIKEHIQHNFTCEVHQIFDIFTLFLTKFYIYTYVNIINKYLKGVTHKTTRDPIKLKAFDKYKKLKIKQLAIRKQKQLTI